MDSKTYVEFLERDGKERYKEYAQYRVKVPHGKAGPWTISAFKTQFDLGYMRLARDGRPPGLGKFTALRHESRGIVMSDTLPEIQDLLPYLNFMKGHVLVSGLGLGMVVHILMTIPRYAKDLLSITVVEKDPHVIKLSGEYYVQKHGITLINADILEWTPPKGSFYDAAWHDIWDNICEDNRPQMTAICKRLSRFVAKGQQYCWGRDTMNQLKRRG